MELEEEIREIESVVLTAEQEASIDWAIANARDAYDYEVAIAAAYDEAFDLIVITLKTGVRLAIPREDLQGLAGADPKLVHDFEIQSPGTSVWWQTLDLGFSIEGLEAGRYGNERWMAKLALRKQRHAA